MGAAYITLSAPAVALASLLSTSRRPVTDPMSMHSLENLNKKVFKKSSFATFSVYKLPSLPFLICSSGISDTWLNITFVSLKLACQCESHWYPLVSTDADYTLTNGLKLKCQN